ncbi:MAG TPA: GntR family transcriptional regulator [Novosphingobium sp.]
MKQSSDPPDASGAVQKVYRGILADLEQGRMVPGQRLVETDLADRFAVGRNAVREAMQRLAARGVVDLARNRSPAIRRLDPAETLEVLEVAKALTVLVLETAARRFARNRHGARLADVRALLERAGSEDEPGQFSRARRAFYRVMLEIGGNRELQRLFPAVGMHIIYAQYQTPALRGIRLADYLAMTAAVEAGEPAAAARAAAEHVAHVAAIIAAREARAGAG